jgi:two-component system, OmpR family, phosphate regulon response regulator PhoB
MPTYSSLAKPTILVVEDEAPLLTLLRYNLEKQGFRVEEAADGQEALLRVAEAKPDLVLLDWMLPALSGIEVCRQIRRRPGTRDLPIIMVTARTEDQDAVRALDTGADDYIAKPFAMEALLARIRALLRRSGACAAKGHADLSPTSRWTRTRIASRAAGARCIWGRPNTGCWNSSCSIRAASSRASSCWTPSGAATSMSSRARWTCTSAGCARRSTGRARPDLIRTVRSAGYALDADCRGPPAMRNAAPWTSKPNTTTAPACRQRRASSPAGQRDAAAFRAACPRAELDLAYGPGEREKLDLFHPEGPPEAPLALFIHGGYWQALDRSFASHCARGMAAVQGRRGRGAVLRPLPRVPLARIVEQMRAALAVPVARTRRRCWPSAIRRAGTWRRCCWRPTGARCNPALPADLVPPPCPISGVFELEPLLPTTIGQGLNLTPEARAALAALPALPGRPLHAVVGGAESGEFIRQSRDFAAAWGGTASRRLPGGATTSPSRPAADPDHRACPRAPHGGGGLRPGDALSLNISGNEGANIA